MIKLSFTINNITAPQMKFVADNITNYDFSYSKLKDDNSYRATIYVDNSTATNDALMAGITIGVLIERSLKI